MEKIVKQYISAWNKKDIAKLKTLFAEGAKYWDAMQEGDAIELLTNSITTTHKAFPDISFEVASLVKAEENMVFFEWQMKGTNTGYFFDAKPTGKKIDIKGLDSITFNSSRISEIKSFYDSSLFNQ